jgi:hypothetical protein
MLTECFAEDLQIVVIMKQPAKPCLIQETKTKQCPFAGKALSIELISLPSKCSDAMQPCNVGWFAVHEEALSKDPPANP